MTLTMGTGLVRRVAAREGGLRIRNCCQDMADAHQSTGNEAAMKPRRVLVALMALALVIPATSAYGADPEPANQEVNVHVLPTNALAVYVENWADFGGLVPGQTVRRDFWLSVLNTTVSGWEVTVTGNDLTSGHWQYCDKTCNTWIDDSTPVTISKSNLKVSGGDIDSWDADTITGPGPVSPDSWILRGTEDATGEFGLNEPNAYLELTIPVMSDDPETTDVDESGVGMQFHTT